jgi:hypothetical protein
MSPLSHVALVAHLWCCATVTRQHDRHQWPSQLRQSATQSATRQGHGSIAPLENSRGASVTSPRKREHGVAVSEVSSAHACPLELSVWRECRPRGARRRGDVTLQRSRVTRGDAPPPAKSLSHRIDRQTERLAADEMGGVGTRSPSCIRPQGEAGERFSRKRGCGPVPIQLPLNIVDRPENVVRRNSGKSPRREVPVVAGFVSRGWVR